MIDRIRGAGIIDLDWGGTLFSDEARSKDWGERWRVPCPGGCRDYIAWVVKSDAPLWHVVCYGCGFSGWVMAPSIPDTLASEETKFRKLMGKFKDIGTVSAEDAVKLWHTKGCPREIAEAAADDPKEFNRLADEFAASSRTKARTI